MTFKEKWNDAWDGFQAGKWNKEVNLRDFIQLNYTPYDGDDSSWLVLLKTQKIYGTKLWIN